MRAVPGTQRISLNRFICDAKQCPAQRDGVVRFQDSDHLSVRFAASLAPQLSEELTRVLTAPRDESGATAGAQR